MENMGDSNSGPGGGGTGFMAGQRTVIERSTYDRLIDALLDTDEDAEDRRIAMAKELTDIVPSWWSGATAHRRRIEGDK